MQNLKNIEENYNAHVDVYDRAYTDDEDYGAEYEKGYLDGIEYVLQQNGVKYGIDIFGNIIIEQEA